MPRMRDENEPLAKTTVDPSVDVDVLCEARKVWLSENQPAIDAYNEQVTQHGVFADTLRGVGRPAASEPHTKVNS